MAISSRIFNGENMLGDIPPITLSEGKLTEQSASYLSDAIRGLIRWANGQVGWGNAAANTQSGNIDGQWKEYYFKSANTTYEIPHGLKRVPVGIIQIDVNVDGAVVRGDDRGDWSTTRLFLRCSQAATTALFVVI
jgi:hypothetical protein